MKRRTFVWLGLLTALMLLATAATVGSAAFAIAALVAILPLPIYLAAALWLDRFEPEPRGMLAMAFLWGASVAVLLSGMLNEAMDAAIGEQMSTVVTAPLVEECLKAVILIRIYTSRKYEFDGVIDGIIYAAMVGLGFAFAENLDYYGRALATDGLGGLALTFTLRGVMAPFSHPMFTAMTGLGLGLARQTRRRWLRIVAPVGGLCGAFLLHSAWNAGASAGCVFFAVYALVMMPALAGLLVVVGFALRREGRLIREQLEREAKLGVLCADDYVQLSSVRGRLHASVDAFRRGRLSAWRQRRAFHQAASELAFLRHRVACGDQPPDPDLEASYVNLLATLSARPPAAGITPS